MKTIEDLNLIITNDSITAVIEGVPKTISSGQRNYPSARRALVEKDVEKFITLLDLKSAIMTFSNDKFEINENGIHYLGLPLSGYGTEIIWKLFEEGMDITRYLKFLEKCMENPRREAVDELFYFLESSKMPLTEDGNFLAYKTVNDDYTPSRSNPDGTFNDNSVGSEVSMKRSEVQNDRNVTCSTGLHFAAYNYASSFSGSRLMILEINPRDVVSVPSDYSNQKGRCCSYKVISEVKQDEQDEREDVLSKSLIAPFFLYTVSSLEEELEELEEKETSVPTRKYHVQRDSSGRFAKKTKKAKAAKKAVKKAISRAATKKVAYKKARKAKKVSGAKKRAI